MQRRVNEVSRGVAIGGWDWTGSVLEPDVHQARCLQHFGAGMSQVLDSAIVQTVETSLSRQISNLF